MWSTSVSGKPTCSLEFVPSCGQGSHVSHAFNVTSRLLCPSHEDLQLTHVNQSSRIQNSCDLLQHKLEFGMDGQSYSLPSVSLRSLFYRGPRANVIRISEANLYVRLKIICISRVLTSNRYHRLLRTSHVQHEAMISTYPTLASTYRRL